MIRISKVRIVEFRGIRDLEIDFRKKSFAICGRNGTGKSGIVDAIEFALTGNISRLGGSGTSGISLRTHGPHVDSRKNPEQAKVILSVYLESQHREVVIERCVKDAENPVITPNTGAILGAISEIANRPEFALSRRELIKYVLSSPGDRSKEIGALLKLEKLESVRSVLQRISNSDKKAIVPLKTLRENAKSQLIASLGITVMSVANVLAAVNEKRKKLGLSEFTALDGQLSFLQDLKLEQSKAPQIIKSVALGHVNSVKELLGIYVDAKSSEGFLALEEEINILNQNPDLLKYANREQFLTTALSLIEDDHCPVCETPMEIGELTDMLKSRLKKYEDMGAKRRSLQQQLTLFNQHIGLLWQALQSLASYGKLLKPELDTTSFDDLIISLKEKQTAIAAFMPLENLIDALAGYGDVPKGFMDGLGELETQLNKLPDPSDSDEAKFFLRTAQEKLEQYKQVSADYKVAEEIEKVSAEVFKVYGETVTKELDELYTKVELRFIEFYRFINSDDESAFSAKLTAGSGKLGFEVDFYGRGYFSPGAYHSEGHQDGMGLCLYLALMDHILGGNFTFCVLDDVLMSVDTGHRREVCKLLKEKFPNTQFVLTTHDEVWLKHMKTEGLIAGGSHLLFRKWDVDQGPNQWNDKDVWTEIDSYLDVNDVRAAAGLLRHYLEYVSAELCHKLRAQVEFRNDAHFTLGDLLPPAVDRMVKLLGYGVKSAASWGKTSAEEELKLKKADFEDLRKASNIESWQTNTLVHFNEWSNLQEKDFRPVVLAYKNLISAFHCQAEGCGAALYVVPEKGNKDTLRCACGETNINLIIK
ncbi:AAA family ATPase [Nubsella zeaxanthinifaciens]|uniref:AAA family ATPase n=1 Tax=Nubsella zeaxanthinifaciens TaxID=392412 RepID=UPI003CFD2F05